jgi:Iap family predicted aminopeptidase
VAWLLNGIRMKMVALYTESEYKDISAKGANERKYVEEIRQLFDYAVEEVFGKNK